jgi:hypothetical protein
MKLDNDILNKMIDASKLPLQQLIDLDFKFWISKDFTDYNNRYRGHQIIKSPLLDKETILFGTELSFLNKFL